MSTDLSYEQEHLFTPIPPMPRPVDNAGVVYTRAWVVHSILDLSGYIPSANLVDIVAIEPAAGDGAFVLAMITRLVSSAQLQGRPLEDCTNAFIAYEIDPDSAERTRELVAQQLRALGASTRLASYLASIWIRCGDFLVEIQRLPRVDFVVGNPPYIRLEDMDEASTAYYRKRYRTMVGRADLYVAFFEAALRLLNPNGVCAFICADRWMLNQYGTELRKFVTSNYSVEMIIEMHEAEAFENHVSAYPAITIIRRATQGPVVVSQIAGDGTDLQPEYVWRTITKALRAGEARDPEHGITATRIDTWFSGDAPWPRIGPDKLQLLRYLEEHFQPLESRTTGTCVSIGVATGADEVFISTDAALIETSRLLPLAMAYDTSDGTLRWSGHYLVNPWNDAGLVSLEEYPLLKRYFETHQSKIRGRHISKKNEKSWYRTIDRVNMALLERPKLYIHDIKDVFNPVLDKGDTYPHHNLYVIYSDVWNLEVLGGLLLSDIAQFFIECYGVRMRGGYLRFQAQYVRRVRVPHPTDLTESEKEALIRAFRTRDRRLASKIAHEVYKVDTCFIE